MKKIIIILVLFSFIGLLSACTSTTVEEEQNTEFLVEFETNGGSLIESITIEEGNSLIEPSDPEKRTSKFLGWFTDEDLISSYSFTSVVNSDMTLYAKWEYNSLTINFFPSRDATEILESTAPLEALLIAELAKLGYSFDEIIIEVGSSSEAVGEALISGDADVGFLPLDIFAQSLSSNNVDGILKTFTSRYSLNKDFVEAVDWNNGEETLYTPDVSMAYYRGLIIAGPSTKGRELADKVNSGTPLTWEDLNSANWCVRSFTSSSGFIYPSIWLMDRYDNQGIIDLSNYVETDGYGTSMAVLAAETCDIATIYGDARISYADKWISSTDSGFGRISTIWEETDVIGVTLPIYTDTVAISNLTVDDELKIALQKAFENIIETPQGLEIFSIYFYTDFQNSIDEDYDTATRANDLFN